jgi:hypothetical protein
MVRLLSQSLGVFAIKKDLHKLDLLAAVNMGF